jgi:hypothetical protein
MEIITRIPPAYFIPIDKTDAEPFQWINAAKIESINLIGDDVWVYLDSKQKLILKNERADKFLEEIHQLNARYRVTAS